jgi:hypothetical protein
MIPPAEKINFLRPENPKEVFFYTQLSKLTGYQPG